MPEGLLAAIRLDRNNARNLPLQSLDQRRPVGLVLDQLDRALWIFEVQIPEGAQRFWKRHLGPDLVHQDHAGIPSSPYLADNIRRILATLEGQVPGLDHHLGPLQSSPVSILAPL